MSTSIGRDFIEKTKSKYAVPSRQSQGLPQPPLVLDFPADSALIALPAHDQVQIPALDLRSAIETRRTIRQYSRQPLNLEELSFLLWLTQGVRRVTSRPSTARNVPSAGARHAFETFLLINHVDGLQPGLYRYIATKHALLPVDDRPDIDARLMAACAGQEQVGNSAVTFFWVAVVDRMYYRYSERGYRYLFLDAGHICQNLYLAAEAVGCGVCAIGAYDDDALNAELGVDGENLFMAYAATLGKRAPRE